MKSILIKTVMSLALATIVIVNANAQTTTVKGQVTDANDGTAIHLCTVYVEGTAN